jgi:hypothetical protein
VHIEVRKELLDHATTDETLNYAGYDTDKMHSMVNKINDLGKSSE